MLNFETVTETDSNDLALHIARRNRMLLELELRRRDEEDSQSQPFKIQPMHEAFATAFPLKQFIRESFSIVVPGVEYRHNWHIDIIAELLQAVTLGEVQNFIINIPRRTMKSNLVCVMWFAWEWSFIPQTAWLFTSYNKDFTKRDLGNASELVKSNWYHSKWGDKVRLVTDRMDKITNTKGGKRLGFKIGKGVGEGGFRVIADDPNDIEDTESDKMLEKINRGWNEVSYHNVTDKQKSTRGIIQQRTNENDVTGNILNDAELAPLYRHLCLPMKFDETHPHKQDEENPLDLGKVSRFEAAKNPNLTFGAQKLWIDPREPLAPSFDNEWYQEWYRESFLSLGLESKGEGQLLWESYLTEEVIRQDIAHLKGFGESAQFQQRPIRRGGNFFNTALFPKVKLETLDLNNLNIMRYFDKAGSDNAGDWTVGLLIGRTKTRPYKFYILDMWRAQLSYFKRMEKMKEIVKQDFEDYVLHRKNNDYTVGIEREGGSSGKDVSSIEKEELIGFDVWIDYKKVSKESRAKIAKQRSEGGYVEVVENPAWNSIFFKRLEKYDPKKANQKDDEIDTLGGCLYYLAFMSIQGFGSSDGYA
jgi:phage terminase large subunit-like protein